MRRKWKACPYVVLATMVVLWMTMLTIRDRVEQTSKNLSDLNEEYVAEPSRIGNATTDQECRDILRLVHMKRLTPGKLRKRDPSEGKKTSKYLAKLFKRKPNGKFLEAGGHDGVFFSNTYYLEEALGWSGVMIEPSRVNFQKLLKSGRNIWASDACITDRPEGVPCEVRTFLEYVHKEDFRSGGGSRLSNYFPEHIDKNVRKYTLDCFPLHDFLEIAGISMDLDLLSLDVQGAELGILESTDWSKVNIMVISVELENPNTLKGVPPLLEGKGYINVGRLNNDFIYIQESLKDELDVSEISKTLRSASP